MQKRKKVLLCVLGACVLLVVCGVVLTSTDAGRALLGTSKAAATPNPKLVIDPNAGPPPRRRRRCRALRFPAGQGCPCLRAVLCCTLMLPTGAEVVLSNSTHVLSGTTTVRLVISGTYTVTIPAELPIVYGAEATPHAH